MTVELRRVEKRVKKRYTAEKTERCNRMIKNIQVQPPTTLANFLGVVCFVVNMCIVP